MSDTHGGAVRCDPASPDLDVYHRLRAALPPGDLDAAAGSAIRLRAHLAESGSVDGAVVMVAYGGGKDSSYALAFVRCMQLVWRQVFGDTFQLRVMTNRHAGMPQAVMENIERVYQALGLHDDSDCELLCVDGDTVAPFRVDLPLPGKVVEKNRTDILMTGHRSAGDGRPTFCNACNLSMVRAFAVAGAYGDGVDVIVTGDSPDEQRAYLAWMNKLARAFSLNPRKSRHGGFNRVLELFDGLSRQYFTDIHGPAGVGETLHDVPQNVKRGLTFFSIYDEADYASGSHWEFLTGHLGFVFDDIAFSFSESDCGNPGLMAHLRGLKSERRYGRSYAEGLAEYVDFATGIMRKKDFPEHLVEMMYRRYEGPDGVRRMRDLMKGYAEEAYGITEEQLVCMVYAPFVDEGAGLRDYLAAEQPDLVESLVEIRGLLGGGGVGGGGGVPENSHLGARMEKMSGLTLGQLATLYRKSLMGSKPAGEGDTILGEVRAGDPHKSVISTSQSPDGATVLELISGR